jgi:hypothetical protein
MTYLVDFGEFTIDPEWTSLRVASDPGITPIQARVFAHLLAMQTARSWPDSLHVEAAAAELDITPRALLRAFQGLGKRRVIARLEHTR